MIDRRIIFSQSALTHAWDIAYPRGRCAPFAADSRELAFAYVRPVFVSPYRLTRTLIRVGRRRERTGTRRNADFLPTPAYS